MNLELDNLLQLPELGHLIRVGVRLAAAALFGGMIGAERERVGKAAGLRTHMLVALGTALFMLAPAEAGFAEGDRGRILQGIAAGIGFIGAGAILKREDRNEIHGLTTAASVWLTAAVGAAAAVGPLWLPVLSVVFALLILHVLRMVQRRPDSSSEQ